MGINILVIRCFILRQPCHFFTRNLPINLTICMKCNPHSNSENLFGKVSSLIIIAFCLCIPWIVRLYCHVMIKAEFWILLMKYISSCNTLEQVCPLQRNFKHCLILYIVENKISHNVNHNKDSDSNNSGWPFNRVVIDSWPQACYHNGYNIFRWWYWMHVITMQRALGMVSIKPYKKKIPPCLLFISRRCLHLFRDTWRKTGKHKFVRIHLGMCTLLWTPWKYLHAIDTYT